MNARASKIALCLVALGGIATSASCIGSETNWLDGPDDPPLVPAKPVEPAPPVKPGFFAECYSDQDCNKGSCLCGTCTVTCSSTADCPGETVSTCSLGDSASYAAQCNVAADVTKGLCLQQCAINRDCATGTCVGGACAHSQDYSGPLVKAATPPPPISGGTLALIDDGHGAAVADPEHDRVHIVSFDQLAVTAVALLSPGDEPGRLLQDAHGFIHVALRRGGALVAIDPQSGLIRERRQVCQYPRGVGYDRAQDLLHVACAGGELVTLPAAGGAPTRLLRLDDDLRDVVVQQDRLLVSRFRSAELLVIDSAGQLVSKSTPPETLAVPKSPAVAWRMVATADGGVLMSHQLEQRAQLEPRGDAPVVPPISVDDGGYGRVGATNCDRIVVTAVTKFDAEGQVVWSQPNLPGALPVDVAENLSGGATIAPAGQLPIAQLVSFEGSAVVSRASGAGGSGGTGGAQAVAGAGGAPVEPCMTNIRPIVQPGQLVAVAYTGAGKLVTQTREPLQVIFDGWQVIPIDVPSAQDTGHELFHHQMRSGIACASCHPEGTEDGHTWEFEGLGKRRTQSLGGRITGTAPFHWAGDMTDFGKLVHEVMTVRMSGFKLSDLQTTALAEWIDAIPAWQARELEDGESIERGRALFNDEQVACAKCHSGDAMTNNQTIDVGTGEPFQVPSLRGVSRRAPFMHDGCAQTLLDRFGACGGGDAHGVTSHLAPAELFDLTSFLQSL